MRKVADSVVFLHDGRVVFFGPVGEIDACDDPDLREFLAMDRVELNG